MINKSKKRGRGRPKKGCLDLAAERAAVAAGTKANAERLGTIKFEETEEGLQVMLSEDKLRQCTKAELKELRRMAERLWDKFEIGKEYKADMDWTCGSKRESTPALEAWDAEHEFLKPKRKNSKKTKSIYDLTDKQKEQKGIALEPVPMEIDVDATEAELEQKLIEKAAAQRISQGQFLQGRRLSGRRKADPRAAQKKNFWH